MSAFIVDKMHINAMVQAAFSAGRHNRRNFSWHHGKEHHELTCDNANEVGQMLLDENIKSVQTRYEGSPLTDLPGRIDCEYIIPFEWYVMGKTPKPIEALSITKCYEYQTCEHDEWHGSNAKSFCDALKEWTISMLPGYEDAPWEWHEEAPDSKPIRLV